MNAIVIQVLRRPKAIAGQVAAIAADRRRGASELARIALGVLAEAAPRAGAPADRYVSTVVALAREIAASRPAMAPVRSAAARLVHEFVRASKSASGSEDAYRILRACVTGIERDMDRSRAALARRYHARFRRLHTVVVISYSSQVAHALGSRRPSLFRVYVCESRPALEGRRTARLLARRVKTVTLVTEAEIPRAVEASRGVVLGCDAVFADGSVANKTGSVVLALAARAYRRPVIVLADRYKLGEKRWFRREPHPASEVWSEPPRGVAVLNETFEIVPAALVDYVVTPRRVYRPREVRTWWQAEFVGESPSGAPRRIRGRR